MARRGGMSESWVAGFKGLDLRRAVAASDPHTARLASNLELTLGGEYRTRPAWKLHATVSQYSVGLYSAGSLLRCAVPGGQSLQDSRPAEVVYDPVGDGAAYANGSLVKLHAMETIGSAELGASQPYVVLERDTGALEHHWLTEQPAAASSAVNTRVSLPFDPGKLLRKAANKLYADDPANGVLRFSSTANGPRDWRAERDAGFLAVRNFAAGDGIVRGLGTFHSYLAVLFEDTIQLWVPDADPARLLLKTVMHGPGTLAPKAVADAMGDMLYVSHGGFHSLSLVQLTGEPKEGDIGKEIVELTKDVDFTNALALWSASRAQYLCAVGTTVYVYINSPTARLTGWTTWTFPAAVDAMCEHQGDVYVRSGTGVYKLDNTLARDDGQSSDIAWDLRPPFLDLGAPGHPKRWHLLDMVQDGTCQVKFYIVPGNDAKVVTGPRWTGPTYGRGPLPMNQYGDAISIGFSGTGLWKLSNYAVRFEVLGGAI